MAIGGLCGSFVGGIDHGDECCSLLGKSEHIPAFFFGKAEVQTEPSQARCQLTPDALSFGAAVAAAAAAGAWAVAVRLMEAASC